MLDARSSQSVLPAGQVVTRTMLLEHVWDYHFDPQTNVIDVHISRLRAKIDKNFDTKGMIDRLKNTPASDGVHRKLLIAYIDIGEAEPIRIGELLIVDDGYGHTRQAVEVDDRLDPCFQQVDRLSGGRTSSGRPGEPALCTYDSG